MDDQLLAEMVVARYPRCGTEQHDWDGFGVLYCDACKYCTHPHCSGEPLVCQICGKEAPHAYAA